MASQIEKVALSFSNAEVQPQAEEKISTLRLVAYRSLQVASALGSAVLILAPGKICLIALGLAVPYLGFAYTQLNCTDMKTTASKSALLVKSLIFVSIPLGAVAGVAALSFGINAAVLLTEAFAAKSLVSGLWSAWFATGTVGLVIPFAKIMLKLPHLMENSFKELSQRCEKIAAKAIKRKCVHFYDLTSFFAICAKPATGTRIDLHPDAKTYNLNTIYNWTDVEVRDVLSQIFGKEFPLQEKMQKLVILNEEVEKLMQNKVPAEKDKVIRELEAILVELQIYSSKFDKANKLGFQLKTPHNFLNSIDQKALQYYDTLVDKDSDLAEEAYISLGAVGIRVSDCKEIAKALKLTVSNNDAFKVISDGLAKKGVRTKKHLIEKGILIDPPNKLTKVEICKNIKAFLMNPDEQKTASTFNTVLTNGLSLIVLYTSLWAKIGLIGRAQLAILPNIGPRIPNIEFEFPQLNPDASVTQKCRYTWLRLSGALLSIHIFAFGLIAGVLQAQFLRRTFLALRR